jgi:guanine nucleotide-binding protein G(o) subunit alpha
MQSLIKAMETMKIQYEDKDNFNVAARIMNVDVESLDLNKMESDWSDAIKKLWKDNGILDCYSKRNQFQLIDSAR